jgi:hypothetical protein
VAGQDVLTRHYLFLLSSDHFVWRYFSKGILASFMEHLGWAGAHRRLWIEGTELDPMDSVGLDIVLYLLLKMSYHLQTFVLVLL